MDLTFAQPWGWWALLGVPAVLLIHLLRRRPRELAITTLFLLEVAAPAQKHGRRLDRLRSSWLLLAQLLAVLLATWLLVEPRWPRQGTRLEVAVVVDASASMQAFQQQLRQTLPATLEGLARGLPMQVVLLSSSADRGVLHRGEGLAGLDAGLDRWSPDLGSHDVSTALGSARHAVGPSGLVLWVTDHPGEDPQGVLRYSVGRATDNVGFTGLRVVHEGGVPRWEATIRNYGAAPARRTWTLSASGQVGPTREVELSGQEVRVVRGGFPEGSTGIELALQPDAFTLDDTLWIDVPRRKRLRVHVAKNARSLAVLEGLLGAVDRVDRVETPAEADVIVDAGPDPDPQLDPSPAQLWFHRAAHQDPRQPVVGVVAEPHELTDGLPWRGLVLSMPPKPQRRLRGEVLLWKGTRALAVRGPGPHLFVRFDPAQSNVHRTPAFVLMLARYLEQVRAGVPRMEVVNVEVAEPIAVAAVPGGGPVTVAAADGQVQAYDEARWPTLRAPAHPGRFEVRQAEAVLMTGTTRFADVREADLSTAGPQPPDPVIAEAHRRRSTQADPFRAGWGLGLLIAMLASFAMSKED